MATREELIEFMNEAERRGDLTTAKQVLKKLEGMGPKAEPRPENTFFPSILGDKPLGEQVKRGTARTARSAADAVAALPLMAMDAGVGARNLVSELVNLNRPPLSTGYRQLYPSYSQSYKEAMDRSPLPPAEGLPEQLVDLVTQAAVGSRTIPNISIKNPAPQGTPLTTLAEQAIKAGDDFNVPVHFDDVAGNTAKRINIAAERVPVTGTGAGKAAQQQAVNKATQKLADEFYIDDFDDIPTLVQKGLQTKLDNARKAATTLYDDVSRQLDPLGNVPTQRFDDALTAQMMDQEAMGTAANPEVMKVLERFASAPRGNFSLLRQIRSQLSDEISGFYKGGSAVGEAGVGPLQAVKKALEADMAKFADDSTPTAKAAWKKANNFYRKMVTPFKEAGLRQLVKTDEPAKVWRYLTQQSQGPARAKKMFMALDSKGRAAVRNGLIDDAVEFATSPKGNVSPAKLAQYMEKHTNAINQFFGGKNLQQLNGFRNLMRHVERAGQYTENPPTGQRVIDFAVGGGVVASALNPAMLKLVAAIEASGAAVTGMFQTKTGRDVLVAMSKMKPGSKQMENAVKVLAATLATQSTGE